jgi:hypothetical protein
VKAKRVLPAIRRPAQRRAAEPDSLWVSALIWSCGFFVAYLLGPILEHLER